jgi:epoxide hydrolase
MWSTSSGGSWPRNSWPISATCTASSSLMARLGYDRYGAQGGDIGAAVAPQLGRVARDHVVGVHVNGGP